MPAARTRGRKPVQYPKVGEGDSDKETGKPPEPVTDVAVLAAAAAPPPAEVFASQDAPGPTPDTDEAASYPLAPGAARIESPRDVVVSVPALKPGIPTDAAGTYALATMSDEEFSQRLATLKRGRDRIAQIQRELMEVDVDYGLIPGTPKPTLFKPGAEKLALIYGLAARLENEFVPGDGEKQPLLKYESACFLHLGSFDGPIVAVGHGTANGWEKRYRRDSDKACPNCGKTAIIKSKFEPGWYCFPKKGGCGSKFAPDDPGIEDQVTDARGDPVAANDLQNTLLKMSEKRAFVDAVLRATASSSLFTQDVAEEPLVDNSMETTAGGAIVDTSTGVLQGRVEDGSVTGDPDRPHLEHDEPDPEVRTADLGEVQRGGHRPEVTDAQITAARELAKSMKMTPWMVADEIVEALGDRATLGEIHDLKEKAAAGAFLLGFMKDMDPDDMGKVIQHLRKLVAA